MADDMTADAPQPSLGNIIGQKLTESIQNMDIATVLQKIVATTPEDEESEEIREKLQGVLEQMNSMTVEEKESFTNKMKEALTSKLSMKLQDPNAFQLDGLQEAIGEAIMFRLYLIVAAAILFIIIIVFFGYKLYKSLRDKEKKREDKKKAKMMKKKK